MQRTKFNIILKNLNQQISFKSSNRECTWNVSLEIIGNMFHFNVRPTREFNIAGKKKPC